MKRLLLLILITASIVSTAFTAHTLAYTAKDVVGYWYTQDKKAKIHIYESGGKYHGKIVWLKEPLDPNGKPKLDKENPDPKKRSQPIVGLALIRDFEWDEDDQEWDDGEIYDPESGKTYSCYMKLQNGGKELYVRGYIGFSMIGRSQIWTKAE